MSPTGSSSASDGWEEEAVIERQIEALRTFLARYPPPAPRERLTGDATAPGAGDAALVSIPADAVEPVEGPLQEPAPTKAHERFLGSRRRQVVAGVALAAAVAAAVALAGLPFRSVAEQARTGTLSVSTNPSGRAVLIDGMRRYVTPVSVDLPPGDHTVEVDTGGERRRIPVTIAAGGQVSHFFELAPVALPLAAAPVIPPAPAVATSGRNDSTAAGWISVAAPSDVQIHEDGRLLGSSRIERIMLPVGRHDLEFVNETLSYKTRQTVQVVAGEVVTVRPRWPQGSVALNATPWAEVWIDGKAVGETPIGNISLPIGVHEIVFRHPDLGERRASVTVAVGKPASLGVDLGAK